MVSGEVDARRRNSAAEKTGAESCRIVGVSPAASTTADSLILDNVSWPWARRRPFSINAKRRDRVEGIVASNFFCSLLRRNKFVG